MAAKQVVVFGVEDEWYGADIRSVSEIIRAQAVTPMPGTPPHVDGIMNVRGKVVPVVNLRKLLGFGSRTGEEAPFILLIESESGPVGCRVDAVDEVLTISEERIEPVAQLAMVSTAAVQGVAKLEDHLVLLVDLNVLLDRAFAATAGAPF
jgi:purine-binding chemotaxis protein CheW